MQLPSTFFGWVRFLLEQYGPLFLSGVGVTLIVAITGTLAANMEQLAQNGAVRAPCIRLSKGDAEIGGTPRHGYKSLVQVVASSICVGFELLAEKYPEAVSYSIHG